MEVKRLRYNWNARYGFLRHLSIVSYATTMTQSDSAKVAKMLGSIKDPQQLCQDMVVMDNESNISYELIHVKDAALRDDGVVYVKRQAPTFVKEDEVPGRVYINDVTQPENGEKKEQKARDEKMLLEIKEQMVEKCLGAIFDRVGEVWMKIFRNMDITETYDQLKRTMMNNLTKEEIESGNEEEILEKSVASLYDSEDFDNLQFQRVLHFINIVRSNESSKRTARMIAYILICDMIGESFALTTENVDFVLDILVQFFNHIK